MAEYTLSEVFGANATQTATDLVIKKADFPGLTADAANTGESLLVALLLHWLTTLTETARIADEANRQIAVTSAGVDIYQGPTRDYLRHSVAVILYNPWTIPTIDPDDY
ncbi:MAG: hypothetical protein ACHWZW_11970 [Spirulina sp.]